MFQLSINIDAEFKQKRLVVSGEMEGCEIEYLVDEKRIMGIKYFTSYGLESILNGKRTVRGWCWL